VGLLEACPKSKTTGLFREVLVLELLDKTTTVVQLRELCEAEKGQV